jgi:hypothetical protein
MNSRDAWDDSVDRYVRYCLTNWLVRQPRAPRWAKQRLLHTAALFPRPGKPRTVRSFFQQSGQLAMHILGFLVGQDPLTSPVSIAYASRRGPGIYQRRSGEYLLDTWMGILCFSSPIC